MFLAFENKDYLEIDRILQRVYHQGFYPKQLLMDLVDLAIKIMAMPETSPYFVSNANRILSVIIPSISKLGNSSNAQTNCRLTLYHALTVWQPSESSETTESTLMNMSMIDTTTPDVCQPSPNVLVERVQTQPQPLDVQASSLTSANQFVSSSMSVQQHQFAFPTGHRPYTPQQ